MVWGHRRVLTSSLRSHAPKSICPSMISLRKSARVPMGVMRRAFFDSSSRDSRYRRLPSKHREIGRRSGHDPRPGASEQSDLAPAIRGLDFC